MALQQTLLFSTSLLLINLGQISKTGTLRSFKVTLLKSLAHFRAMSSSSSGQEIKHELEVFGGREGAPGGGGGGGAGGGDFGLVSAFSGLGIFSGFT